MPAAKKIRVVILGASGYTGAELLRLLMQHPQVEIAALTAESQAGKPMAEVYPHLALFDLPPLVTVEQVEWKNMDAVFCCLPHGTTQEIIAKLPTHLKIIDLSADFRLADIALYAKTYGHAHQATALQKEAVYGLSEHARGAIKTARLVACPGCYPTSAQLPLIPLLKEKLIDAHTIIIDSKSGVTGAGRAAKQANLFSEINEGVSAYGIANHRHAPEIEQGLSQAAGQAVTVSFTPHLIPMSRGILSTIHVQLAAGKTAGDLRKTLEKAYDHESFVKLLPEGMQPTTHMVKGTNFALINVFADRIPGHAILVCAIDNLVKGASGQAVQNFNIMYGFAEETALRQGALFP